MEPLPGVFDVTVFRKDFLLSGKSILRVVTLLEACDVTRNGCHLGFHHEKLEIRLNRENLVIFFALHEK